MTRLQLPALALLTCLLSGCIAQVPYTPRDDLVQELGGVEQAGAELTKVLKRAEQPQVTEVTLEPGSFVYAWKGQAGPVGPYAHDGNRSVYFKNVQHIDIFENLRVYLEGDIRLGDFLFTSLGDAQRFADLVWSFKAQGGE